MLKLWRTQVPEGEQLTREKGEHKALERKFQIQIRIYCALTNNEIYFERELQTKYKSFCV